MLFIHTDKQIYVLKHSKMLLRLLCVFKSSLSTHVTLQTNFLLLPYINTRETTIIDPSIIRQNYISKCITPKIYLRLFTVRLGQRHLYQSQMKQLNISSRLCMALTFLVQCSLAVCTQVCGLETIYSKSERDYMLIGIYNRIYKARGSFSNLFCLWC